MGRHRRNPSFGNVSGEIEDAVWGAGGLFATAALSDKYVSPIFRHIIPSGNEMLGKAVDAASSFIVAKGVGMLAEKVSAAGGRLAYMGGLFYTGAKVISIPLSSFTLTVATGPLSLSSLTAGTSAAATPALPTAAGALPGQPTNAPGAVVQSVVSNNSYSGL